LFKDLTGDSDLITLAAAGPYTLTAHGMGGQSGIAFAFYLEEVSQTSLPLGAPLTVSLSGSAQAQLFRVVTTNSGPLQIILSGVASANRVDLYAKRGAPPTRADYGAMAANSTAGDLQLLIPLAPAGTWYFLVYGDYIATPSDCTLSAAASGLVLTRVTPDHHADNADATLTLTGAGFDNTTAVTLVSSNGTAYAPATASVDSFTQITATFAANTAPPGLYSVRVSNSSTASQLPGAFQMVSGGHANLQTQLIVPNTVGYHILATLYVDYANTGDAAMSAPLLVVTGTQRPLMTVSPVLVTSGFWTYSPSPAGFSQTVQVLASGAIPGVLQPGESCRVPVYVAGLQPPWDTSNRQV
jgi:hypothetical protein